MLTSLGSTALADGSSYTSVNGRVYLPDLRNYALFKTKFLVRNQGTVSRIVTIYYYDQWGNPTPQGSDECVLPAGTGCGINTWELNRIPSGSHGSAFIDGGENVLAVAEPQTSDNDGAYAYEGLAASDGFNPGWGQVGKTLYAPVIMRDYWGWYSELVIFNTSSSTSVTVTVEYYDASGLAYTTTLSVPRYGVITTNYYYGTSNVLYAARITSPQPIAAIVRQYQGKVNLTYNALSSSTITTHVPLIMNNYYGWDTSVNIQNTSSVTASITLQYYNPDGTPGPSNNQAIAPYSTASFYSSNAGLPNGFIGAARISSTGNQPLAVVVNQSGPHGSAATQGKSYDGIQEGSVYLVMPDVLNYFDDPDYAGNEQWVSSVNVQNLGSASTTVTLYYKGGVANRTINQNGMYSFYLPVEGWGTTPRQGPAILTASGGQPIAVVVNHGSAAMSGRDLDRSYDGANR